MLFKKHFPVNSILKLIHQPYIGRRLYIKLLQKWGFPFVLLPWEQSTYNFFLQNTSLFFGPFSVVCVPLPPTSHFGFPDFKRDLEFFLKIWFWQEFRLYFFIFWLGWRKHEIQYSLLQKSVGGDGAESGSSHAGSLWTRRLDWERGHTATGP